MPVAVRRTTTDAAPTTGVQVTRVPVEVPSAPAGSVTAAGVDPSSSGLAERGDLVDDEVHRDDGTVRRTWPFGARHDDQGGPAPTPATVSCEMLGVPEPLAETTTKPAAGRRRR